MKLGIMQPYFFPYIGYWQLINYTDEWVFFDVVQYNKKSWMNRNKILHPDKDKEFQYISVPIKKHERGTLISEVLINNEEKWKDKIRGQLTVYKKLKAPYYEDVIGLINSIFGKEYKSFLSLSIESVKAVCEYLEIDLEYKIASDIEFDRSSIKGPGDWALEISKSLKASQYINPPGGYKIFDEDKYLENEIKLLFLKSDLEKYRQSWRENFIEGLSIIDVMMFNGKDKTKELIENSFSLMRKKDLKNRT
jgi:hypothetical protein